MPFAIDYRLESTDFMQILYPDKGTQRRSMQFYLDNTDLHILSLRNQKSRLLDTFSRLSPIGELGHFRPGMLRPIPEGEYRHLLSPIDSDIIPWSKLMLRQIPPPSALWWEWIIRLLFSVTTVWTHSFTPAALDVCVWWCGLWNGYHWKLWLHDIMSDGNHVKSH